MTRTQKRRGTACARPAGMPPSASPASASLPIGIADRSLYRPGLSKALRSSRRSIVAFMDEILPRRRSRQEPAEPVPVPVPVQPPAPALPAEAAAAPALPAVFRLCSFCNSRQPLGELVMVADSLQCADLEACGQRAAASGLYAMREDELEISGYEAMQGALPCRDPAQSALDRSMAAQARADAVAMASCTLEGALDLR